MAITRRKYLVIVLTLFGVVVFLLLGLALWLREEDNYSCIEDGLYLGGAVPTPPRGTKAVINLCEKKDPYLCDFNIWEPIADSEPAPDIEWLRRMVELVADKQHAGIKTYIHCRNGVSRSGMLVVAYEMRKNNWTRDDALAFVRTKRPITRPNPAFLRRLLEWQRVLKGELLTPSSATSAR